MAIVASTPPLLQLDDELRSKIVKAVYKHDPVGAFSRVEKLVGPARLKGAKPVEVQAHLTKWSGKDERLLRWLLKIWFEQRHVLRDHVRQALVAADHDARDPDFNQPLPAGRSNDPPAGVRLKGEPADQSLLMAWLLQWSAVVPLAGTDPIDATPAADSAPAALAVGPGTALALVGGVVPDTLAGLEAALAELKHRFATAAVALQSAAEIVRAERLPTTGLPDLAALAEEQFRLNDAAAALALALDQPWLHTAPALAELQAAVPALRAAAEVWAAASAGKAQARAWLAKAARLRHREEADFGPLRALQTLTEQLARQLDDTGVAATGLAAELAAGTHLLARFVNAVETYHQLRAAGTNALMQAAAGIETLPEGMLLYTACVTGLLEIVPADGDSEATVPVAPEMTVPVVARPPESLPAAEKTADYTAAQESIVENNAEATAAEASAEEDAANTAVETPASATVGNERADSSPIAALSATTAESVANAPQAAPVAAAPPPLPPALPAATGPEISFDPWELLHRDEVALLYQLAASQELADPAPQGPPLPPTWLLRPVLLAPLLHSAYGPLAALLRQDAPLYDLATLDDDPAPSGPEARRLLAVATALRVGLVLPEFRDHHWLAEAGNGSLPCFGAYCRRVAERPNPAPLSSELLRQTQTLQAWREQAATFRQELEQWSHDQRTQSRFHGRQSHPIVRLWQGLLDPGRLVGRLVRGLDQLDPTQTPALEAGLALLQDVTALRSNMQEAGLTLADLATIDSNKDSRIWLEDRVADLRESFRRYQELVAARPGGGPGDYYVQSDRELVERLLETQPEALAELEHAAAAEKNLPRRVALGYCVQALQAVHTWLQPQLTASPGPAPTEPLAHLLLAPPLLRLPGLDLTDDWQPAQPADPALYPALARLASQPAPEPWATVYDRAAAAPPDHRTTARLLALAEAERAALDRPLPELWALRETDVRRQKSVLLQRVEQAEAEVERGRRYGYVTEGLRRELTDQLDKWRKVEKADPQTATDQWVNFRQLHQQLEALRGQLATARDQATAAKTVTVRQMLASLPIPATADDEARVEQALRDGCLSLVDDYLPALQRGQRLDRTEAATAPPLMLTLPIALDTIEQQLRQHPQALQVVAALRGHALAPALPTPSPEEAERAATTYEKWAGLRLGAGRLRDAAALKDVAAVLEFVGFSGAEAEPRAAADRLSYGLSGFRGEYTNVQTASLRDKTLCPVSYFGSEANGNYRLLCLWEMPAKEELVRLVRKQQEEVGHTRPVLVLLLAQLPWLRREELADYCRREHATFLLLDELLLLYLATHGLGQSRLPLFFRLTLPFTYLKPYGPSGMVYPEMFYGREDEQRHLVQRGPNSAFIVYGGRQLGKTALLRQVERDHHRPGRQQYVVFLDIYQLGRANADVRGLAGLLLDHLRDVGIELPAPERRSPGPPTLSVVFDLIGKWLQANAARTLLFLLDEADQFMEEDAANDFHQIAAVRRAIDQHSRLKIVFSGLHNVQKTKRQSNQPLAQFKNAICIGPLDFKQGARLIRIPLESLGFYFGDALPDGTFRPADQLVDQIIVETNYFPSLIQIFCDKLLDELYAAPRRPGQALPFAIGEAMVQRASGKARKDIRDKFELTLELNKRYSLLANLVASLTRTAADSHGVALAEVREDACYYWADAFEGRSESYVLALLEEMEGLGVLERSESAVSGTRFRLRTSNVRALFGTDDEIEQTLSTFESQPPPAEYRPSIARMAYLAPGQPARAKRRRSPLTAEDLGRLETHFGLTLVRGTDAAGRPQLAEFLLARHGKDLRVLPAADLPAALDKLAAAKTWPRLLLVQGPCDAALLGAAVRQLAHLRGLPSAAERPPLAVAVEMNPAELWAFSAGVAPDTDPFEAVQSQDVRLLDLLPWNAATVSEWLQDEEFALGDKPAVARDTGGWHGLLLDFFATETQHSAPAQHLRQLRHALALPAARARWGLADAPAFFGSLAELNEPFALADAVSYAEGELSAAAVARYLRWAETLRLLRRNTADGRYRFDATVAQLFQTPADPA